MRGRLISGVIFSVYFVIRHVCNILCYQPAVLIFEPENTEAKQFFPLLEEKVGKFENPNYNICCIDSLAFCIENFCTNRNLTSHFKSQQLRKYFYYVWGFFVLNILPWSIKCQSKNSPFVNVLLQVFILQYIKRERKKSEILQI